MKINNHITTLIKLNQMQRSTTNYMGEAFYEEFQKHQAIVVKEYLPLLTALADAGVLYVWVEDLNEDRRIESVCENGGFQFNAERCPVDLASPRPYQDN